MDDRRQGCRAACERTGDSRGCPKLCLWTRPLVRWHTRSSGRTGGYRLDNRGLALCPRSEEHTSELQSRGHLVCRLLLEKKKKTIKTTKQKKIKTALAKTTSQHNP